ncbi:hypothetical protein IDM40_10360 [Nocardiopsis sp. HNM0947]|uniref:Uncharacterized protein n=1 Tax=Nocardiopsis coralli TaxID=2772213 RepID=A0ABR9P5L6_9ACTN|nr:hypothetical protein [Nocardiopsis coralli]
MKTAPSRLNSASSVISPSSTEIQIRRVRSARRRNSQPSTSPASPYAPRMSPTNSSDACTRPKAMSHRLRRRRRAEASRGLAPDASWRRMSCTIP